MKKIGFLLLVILLATLAIPGFAVSEAADGDFIYVAYPSGHSTVKTYTGENSDVVIPETLGGYPVTRIGSGLFSGKKEQITSVTFPDTVTLIEDNVLNNMPNLKKVILPAGLQALGQNNFIACNGVEEAVLPAGMFYVGWGCFSSDCDFRLTFTGPVPVMREEFSLWRTETGTVIVPDDLAE